MTPIAAIAYVRQVAHNPRVPVFVRLCRGRDGVRVDISGHYEIDCLDKHGNVTAKIVDTLPSPLEGCAGEHALTTHEYRSPTVQLREECDGHGGAVMAAEFR